MNLIPKSSQPLLPPALSRIMILPCERSPYGRSRLYSPSWKPFCLTRSSVSDDAKTATRGAKDLTMMLLCVSLLSDAEVDGDDPWLLKDERSRLCDRKSDGDLDLDNANEPAVSGRRDSELDRDSLVLIKDEESETVMSGRSPNVTSLDDLTASSGCRRRVLPPGLPISCSEGVIDGETQYLSSSSA